jgi:type VI secretion system protein ImpJ
MFLQPQHFQQQDRYFERLLEGRTRPLLGNGWGFTKLQVDQAALALGKIQIASARGVLPDGTPFSFPDLDPPPAALDVPPDARDEKIVLAIPLKRQGAEEAGEAGPNTDLTRFGVVREDIRDSNASAQSTAPIGVGRLRLRLALGRNVTDAFAVLGTVRVRERRSDNQIVLNADYIPPVLDVRSDPTLANYLRDLHGRLHQRGEALATHVAQPGPGGIAEIAHFLFLQTVNRYEPVFAHLSNAVMLHPEQLYARCVELAGDLATFAHQSRRPTAFPGYQHDDLEQCFRPLMLDLYRSIVGTEIERNAVAIELQDRKFGVKVGIVPDLELLKTSSLVLAVNAQLPPDVLRSRFPSQATVAPAERIRDLVNSHLPGIPVRPMPVAPRQIPFHAGFNYFELERGGELWKQLERTGGIAMHIAGEFPGLQIEFWAVRG